jgi:nucleoside triphosphate diphosphatase
MKSLENLLAVMDRLRDPETGCPWDREQNFATIAPYTIEEAYEVADAIAQDDLDALKDELGDLLFQVVFHARLAKERDAFDFDAVAGHIADKMIRRHPHVFADAEINDVEAQNVSWEEQKATERAEKAERTGAAPGLLDGIPLALPALSRAAKLQKRAARVGFDWPDLAPVLAKIDEELAEVTAEIEQDPRDPDRIEDEIGDLLFVVANLARHLAVDPETALRRTNAKFERRFRAIEAEYAAQGKDPAAATLDHLDAAWERAKAAEKAG